jgi:AcrR family transcriptional regulator
MARKSYHHGDLPRALVGAALELIAERGVAGFTFAEAARRAGVSAAAPYRHFRDRDALLGEAARQGFGLFADRLAAAWNDGCPTPLRAFEAVGRAYLAFAREEQPYYAAMFAAGLGDACDDPDFRSASARAFEVLRVACAAVAAQIPAERRPPAHMMAYHVWSLSHGVATLFVAGGGGPAPIPAEDMLESAVAIYLRGLGLIPTETA